MILAGSFQLKCILMRRLTNVNNDSSGTVTQAETLIRLVQNSDMPKFDERFNKLEKAENVNLANKQAKRAKADQDQRKMDMLANKLSKRALQNPNEKRELIQTRVHKFQFSMDS